MAVQAGIWNFDGRSIDRKLLDDFSELLKRQGPDGESAEVNGSVAMLYRPFHTTAESRREKQPHTSRRGFIFTWDGRLDNRDDLVAELQDSLEAQPTDVEIVAAAFDRWETNSFRLIIGDWALSIWKPQLRELIFAVDYMAIRHIFYHLKRDRVWWSTDLAPLVLLSGVRFRIDDDYVAGYFAHDPDAHLTPYREIREAPPGQFVRIRDGRATLERYWRIKPECRIRYKTDAAYEDHFRHLFRQSVHRRLRSDSPVLAELSGGLDSSAIVCMADDILAKGGANNPQLETLSYYDRSEPGGDDWIYFPIVEKKRGRAGVHIDTSKLVNSPSLLDHSHFSALPGRSGIPSQVEEERAAVVRDGKFRVVLSGIGGDEFMGGIPDPREQLADLLLQFKLVALARQLVAWSVVKRLPLIQLLSQAAMEFMPATLRQHLTKEAKVELWIDSTFAKRTGIAVRLLDSSDHFGFCLPTRRSYATGISFMANRLAKWGPSLLELEEPRYPYLDQQLMEFVTSIPASQLLRPGDRRSLMRRSLVGIVPLEILSRRTKQIGSRTPAVALGNNLKYLKTIFESPISAEMGYINKSQMHNVLSRIENGKEVHLVRMFRAIALELWLRDLTSRFLIDGPMQSERSTTKEGGVRAIA